MFNTTVKLGKVCDIQGGFAFKSDDFTTEGIPLIRIGSIADEKIELNESTVFLPEQYLEKYTDFVVRKGDILIALSGATTGKTGIYTLSETALLNQRVGRIIPNTKFLDNIYVYFYMSQMKQIIYNKAGGAAQPNISPKDIKEITIFLPPLETQKEIAAVLDKAQELIDKRKEQLAKMDEFVQSVFLEMFGDLETIDKRWDKVSVSDVCTEIVDCVNKTAPQVEYVTPFKMVRTSNIKSGKIYLNSVKYVEKSIYDKWTRRSVPQRGDILLTREAPMGEVGIIDFDDFIFLGQRVMQYRCKEHVINPIYLMRFMQCRYFQNQIRRLGKGSTVKHLAVPDCFSLNVALPPLDLQNQFATIVKKTEQQKALMQQSLAEMVNNFNSLMQRAFKGELF